MRSVKGKGYILIEWPWLVRKSGQFLSGSPSAKAVALFPFIIVASRASVPDWLIRHELIHFRQLLDTLVIGLPLLTMVEYLYARVFLNYGKMQSYLYGSAEQEAYLHMHDSEYLVHRKFGALWRHVFHKQQFNLVGPGRIEFVNEYHKV